MSRPKGLPSEISELLLAPTSEAWVDRAVQELPVLLLDHANCEKKAASTALSLMFRYPQMDKLTWRMSRLAREELRPKKLWLLPPESRKQLQMQIKFLKFILIFVKVSVGRGLRLLINT